MVKNTKLGLGILLVLILGLVLVQYTLNAEASTNISEGYTRAIFEKDEAIYLYEASKGITLISDPEESNLFPVLSVDRKQLAYAHPFIDKETNKFGVELSMVNFENNSSHQVELTSDEVNAVMGIDWVGDARIGVEGHVNPSTSKYFVLDAVTGEEINSYVGAFFTVLPNHSIMYRSFIPYNWEHEYQASYAIDEEEVYTSPNKGDELSYPQLSENYDKIAFVETSIEGIQHLVVADFDLRTISNVQKYKIDDEVTGVLKFSNGQVGFFDDHTAYIVSNGRLVRVEQKVNFVYQYEKTSKIKQLEESLNEKFGNEESEERFYLNSLSFFN